jgi:DNA invertase Pin-like site-specific DNA recombinase
LDKLKHCDKIYQETQSGTNQQRSQLAACLEYVRDGDTLIVSRLDRVARSTLHLCTIAEFEPELRSERQLDGINKAKELGVKFGRSKRLSPQQIVELQLQRQQGVLIKILMKDFNLSKASVYRYLGKPSSEVP